MANGQEERIRIVQETVAGKEITFAHVMGGPAPIRALLANPRILILDEATSSIDTETEILLQKGLNELLKGRTSFIIAHRLSTIKNADCIMYVDKGGILERGSHEELLAQKGAYYELYLSQYDFLTRNAEEETTADSPLRLEPARG